MSAAPRPVVVLLHASGSSSRQWDALAQALEPRLQVHAIDLLGHGRQPGRPGATVHDEAALVQPLLQAAGAVHLVGHSYGGAVAVHLAAAQPARVLSLAVYEPVLFSLLAEHEPWSPAAAEARALAEATQGLVGAGEAEAAAARFVDYWSGPGTWAAMPASRRDGLVARMPFIAQHFETLYREPLPVHVLARLRMPLLCLRGSRSTPAARSIAALLQRLLPQGRHDEVPEAGHMGPLTHAAAVNPPLLAFLHAHALARRAA